MKKHILIVLFLFLEFTVYSQNKYRISELTNISKKSINSLENATNSLIKKDKKLHKMKGLKQLNIFWLPFDCDIPKEEYIDKKFLHKLTPEYYVNYKGDKYLRAEFLIYDSLGNGIAHGDHLFIYGYYNDCPGYKYSKEDYYLIKLILNNEIDFVFKLDLIGGYICVKDSNIFVVDSDKDFQLIIDYNWEEYISNLYEKYIDICDILNKNAIKKKQ